MTNTVPLEVLKVNRFKANWDPATLFSGFNIRAIISSSGDAITNINRLHQLSRKLSRDIGVEGDDWILQDNSVTGDTELYLKNSGQLLVWKLQDNNKFLEVITRVEQHKDNLDDEVREDE